MVLTALVVLLVLENKGRLGRSLENIKLDTQYVHGKKIKSKFYD
jgi:hypothetical protein